MSVSQGHTIPLVRREDDQSSPRTHKELNSKRRASILEKDSFFARKFPLDADLSDYDLHIK